MEDVKRCHEISNGLVEIAKSVIKEGVFEDNDKQDDFVKVIQTACNMLLHEASEKEFFAMMNA